MIWQRSLTIKFLIAPSLFFILVFLFQIDMNAQSLYWEGEAEDGIITGTAEITTSCNNASGGEFVRLNAEPGNSLFIDGVTVPDSGWYRLKIHYFYIGEQPVEIMVNGDTLGVYYLPSATWCYQGPAAVYAIDIFLNKGSNTLQFNTYEGQIAPFMDKFLIEEKYRPAVRLEASACRILPSQNIEFRVYLQSISSSDESVYIGLTGLDRSEYLLSANKLTVVAGKTSASAVFKFTGALTDHEKVFKVTVDSVSAGLQMGIKDTAIIQITDQPGVFYVSSTTGDDKNNGLSVNTPWKTTEKVSSFSFLPGDSLLLKSGDVFAGQLSISNGGTKDIPVYIGSYDDGPKPVIDGAGDPGGSFSSAVTIKNCSHLVMENLKITNNRRTSREGNDDIEGYGVEVLNSGESTMQDIRLTNLDIEDVYALTLDGVDFNSVDVAGIDLQSTGNFTAGQEKQIRDVVIENCYITHTGKYGILSRHGGGGPGIGNDTINRNMNIVVRNNHFYETGGAAVTLTRTYNALLENNLIEYPGSGYDPRMVHRGSGAWFWRCINVMAQHNTMIHGRGPMDSYSMHVDFGNRNVFLQYNYSEDTEGGFVEILGENVNSVYRYNVSVNDGFRDSKGYSVWVSQYAGKNSDGTFNWIPSDSNYIYNNTIFVDGTRTPDIFIDGKNTFIYNNIFYASGNASIGEDLTIQADQGASVKIRNNLYHGQVSSQFSDLDGQPVFGDPLFTNAGGSDFASYNLEENSIALDSGFSFTEPVFPNAGRGIFSHISPVADRDILGNPVNIEDEVPNIGAVNCKYADTANVGIKIPSTDNRLRIFPNPAGEEVTLRLSSPKNQLVNIHLINMRGQEIGSKSCHVSAGITNIRISLPENEGSNFILVEVVLDNERITRRIMCR